MSFNQHFFFTKSISSNQKTVTIVGNFTSFQYPMVKTIVGASLHLLTSSCHICLSSDCHSTPFLSTLWCCLPISLSVFLSFFYLVQFLVGLFWHVLCILWHAHTTLHLVSLLWSEDLYETPLRLWLCSVPLHLWCGLCLRCQGWQLIMVLFSTQCVWAIFNVLLFSRLIKL